MQKKGCLHADFFTDPSSGSSRAGLGVPKGPEAIVGLCMNGVVVTANNGMMPHVPIVDTPLNIDLIVPDAVCPYVLPVGYAIAKSEEEVPRPRMEAQEARLWWLGDIFPVSLCMSRKESYTLTWSAGDIVALSGLLVICGYGFIEIVRRVRSVWQVIRHRLSKA